LKNTVIEKHKKASHTTAVTEDTEKLANAVYVSCFHITLLLLVLWCCWAFGR